MFSSPERFGNAERETGRRERATQRSEDAAGRGRSGSSDADAVGDDAGRAGEAAIDDAVEMTFPASDPPAWMSSGMPGPDAAAPDRAEGGA